MLDTPIFKKQLAKKYLIGLVIMICSLQVWAEEYWLDVRIPEQYAQQHIDGAINIPLDMLPERVAELVENKDDIIHLYCNSGRQSGLAKKLLNSMGYTAVIDEGGFEQASEVASQNRSDSINVVRK